MPFQTLTQPKSCEPCAQAEYNKLRHVQQIIYRRRVSQKMQGRRQTTRKDQQEWDALWQQAVKRYEERLIEKSAKHRTISDDLIIIAVANQMATHCTNCK
jgi:hypothetical protein